MADRGQRLVAVALAAFAGLSALFKLSSYDLWWHLAAGRYMAEGHGIPRSDPFSYTAKGAAWIDHEWLFQLVVWAAHRLTGSTGLIVLRMALVTAAVLLGWAALTRWARLAPAPAALVMLLFVVAGRDRFLLRPELFTMLFAALLLSFLLVRPSPPGLSRDWWLVPLFALWANLHAGLIVGVVLLAAIVAGRVLEGVAPVGLDAPMSRRQLIDAGSLVVATTAAGLANPFGYLVYVTPFELTALIESGLYDNLEWRRPGLHSQWLFYALAAAVVVVVAVRLRERRWTAILPLAFLVLISLRYVRNIGLFGLLAPILVAAILVPTPGTNLKRRRLAGIGPAIAVPLLLLSGGWLVASDHRFPGGFGIDGKRVPAGGVAWMAEHRPAGNLYNVYGFGGYVAWQLWPEVEIFIDGRNEVFREVRAELRAAVSDSRRWNELIERHDINSALVSWGKKLEQVTLMDPDGGPPTTAWWPWTVTHFPRSRWALVHWDDSSAIYLRREGPNRALIDAHEVHHVYPADPGYQLEAIVTGRADLEGCVAELEAKLDRDPSCQRARTLLDRITDELLGGRPLAIQEGAMEPCLYGPFELDRDRSLLEEQRRRFGTGDDVHERLPALTAANDPAELTTDVRVDGRALLLFDDDGGPGVDGQAFPGGLDVVDATALGPGQEIECGTVSRATLEALGGRQLALFLLRAHAVVTWVHIGSELCLVEESDDPMSYEARFTGQHTYYTNEENVVELDFSIHVQRSSGQITVRGN